MPEKCTDNPRDCPLVPRVEALEQENKRHTETHKEMFSRLNAVEKDNAVQDANYKAIDEKLDELTIMVKELTGKSGKRWDSLTDKAVWAIVAAVIAFLLGRIGL